MFFTFRGLNFLREVLPSSYLAILVFQAQKYFGVEDKEAQDCVNEIRKAQSPEEAARLGRTLARKQPNLVSSCLESLILSNP